MEISGPIKDHLPSAWQKTAWGLIQYLKFRTDRMSLIFRLKVVTTHLYKVRATMHQSNHSQISGLPEESACLKYCL